MTKCTLGALPSAAQVSDEEKLLGNEKENTENTLIVCHIYINSGTQILTTAYILAVRQHIQSTIPTYATIVL